MSQGHAELSISAQDKVKEMLAGLKAVREGLFDVYFVHLPTGSRQVTKDNVDEAEADLRRIFTPIFPGLAQL